MDGARTRGLLDFAYEVARAEGLEDYRRAVTTGIRKVVPADLASYTEVDLARGQVLAQLDPPISAHASIAALGRCAHQHPLVTRQEPRAQTISDYLSARRFHGLELYHDCYRPLDAEDQIAINLPARRGSAIGVAMNRSRRSFSQGDRATLDELRPLLIKSYRRAAAYDRGRELASAHEAAGAGVIIIGHRGSVDYASPRAHRWLRAYFPLAAPGRLPEELAAWLKANRNRLGQRLTVTRQGQQLHVSLVADGSDQSPVLELDERHTWFDRLTPREAQILHLLSAGETNQQMADGLAVSRRTVENHLQSIYRKLGVSNRTAAAATIRQRGGGPSSVGGPTPGGTSSRCHHPTSRQAPAL
jgi:DNA-binding CsgD family transcriptional regulator